MDQRISKSVNTGSILTLSTDTNFTGANGTHASLTDGQFVVVSNDGSATTTTSTEFDSVLSGQRVDREWKLENTGNVTSVNMQFDGFDNTYALFADNDGNFSTGAREIGRLSATGSITVSLGSTAATMIDDEEFFIIALSNDTDGDGVSNVIEDAGQNGGDGNGDGIPDSEQSGVSAAPNPLTGDHTILQVTGECTVITENELLGESSLVAQDPSFDYPFGLIDFQVQCATSGDSADVTIYYSELLDTSNFEYRKFDGNGNAYSDLTDLVTFGNHTYSTGVASGTTVTTVSFTVTDGDSRTDEDGVADGFINDPSGPAVVITSPSSSSRSAPSSSRRRNPKTGKAISETEIAQIFGKKVGSQELLTPTITKAQCFINYTRLIKQGMRGEDVKQVQTCMNSLGYTSGPEDGIYGPLTYAGITAYQRDKNLKWIDGVVGPETSGSLNALSSITLNTQEGITSLIQEAKELIG